MIKFCKKQQLFAKAFIVCLLFAGLFTACDSRHANEETAGAVNVRALADGSKFVGNIIAVSAPSDFSNYWNQVTPENGCKWGSVEQSQNNMNWSQGDVAYNYARQNGIPFRFHTLVWGSQEPGWIGGLSSSDQLQAVENWIYQAGQRYGDSEFVDVVNEPLHQPASYREAIGGSGSTGWDWIVWSFERARENFPNAKLCINEYGVISDPSLASQYVDIINILKERGLIDGIGIQCHQFNMDSVSVSTMNRVLNTLSSTGLPIYVTELDITGDDNTQQQRYQEKFPVLYENSNVKGITLWGYIEGQTWKSGTHLITSSGQERPALQWLRQYLQGNAGDDDDDDDDYTGSIPGMIEAEDYTSMSGVEVESCGEGGQNLGYIDPGDWMEYQVNVEQSGTYTVEYRVATQQSNASFSCQVNGSVQHSVSVPNTGAWQTYQSVSNTLSLSAGTQTIRLVSNGDYWNLNYMNFQLDASGDDDDDDNDSGAFSTIQAENYSSTTSSTVQIIGTDNGGSGIGYLQSGDTFTYRNIDFGSGAASVSVRCASQQNTSIQVRLGSSSGTLLGTIADASTGSWDSYQDKSANISNVTGIQNIVLVCSGAVNIDSFIFSASDAAVDDDSGWW